MALAPSNVEVSFTDWAMLRRYKGESSLTSKSSREERTQFILAVGNGQAPMSLYAWATFLKNPQFWSWDAIDLEWEATFSLAERSPVYLLRFRDDFDLAPVLAHFEERHFSREQNKAVVIYTHPAEPKPEWADELSAMFNVAVFADDKLFILSPSLDKLRAVLDQIQERPPSTPDGNALQAVAKRLGEVAGADIYPGAIACQKFNVDAARLRSGDSATKTAELLKENSPLHAYDALGLGYRYDGAEPVGTVVLHYSNPADAQADLELRRKLVEKGISVALHRPYSETLFTLERAKVEDGNIVLSLRPHNNLPRYFLDAIVRHDLLFASCPAP